MKGLTTVAGIEALIAFSEVQLALQPELDYLAERVIVDGDPQREAINRRAYTRSAFAHIEATTYLTKQAAVKMDPGLLNDVETANLVDEKTFGIKDNGDPREGVSKIRLSSNVLFALKLFARATGEPYEHDFKSEGWLAFLEAVTVRDRLMHPRGVADLSVSLLDIRAVMRANLWFSWAVRDRFIEARKILPTITSELGNPVFVERLTTLGDLTAQLVEFQAKRNASPVSGSSP